MPVKLDGDGYTAIMEHKDGATHFGVFCALVKLAATCQPRGIFCHSSGRPMDIKDFIRRTRVREEAMTAALKRLTDKEIGWIVEVEYNPSANVLADDANVLASSDHYSTEQDSTEQDKTRQDKTGATENPRAHFEIPSVGDVVEYGKIIGVAADECQTFHDHYTSNGWRVGQTSMRDWKAALRKWRANVGQYRKPARQDEPKKLKPGVAYGYVAPDPPEGVTDE